MICDKCGNLLNENGICPNCNIDNNNSVEDNNVQLENSGVENSIKINDTSVVSSVVEVQQLDEINSSITNDSTVVNETPVVEPVSVIEPQPIIEQSSETITTGTESESVVQPQQVVPSVPITSDSTVVNQTPVVEPVSVIETQPIIEQTSETITTGTESESVVQPQQVVPSAPITSDISSVNTQQNLEQPTKSSSKKLIIIFASIIGVLLIVFIILLILKPWVKDEENVDQNVGSIKDSFENVNGMFNEAKKNTFVTEVQKYMDTSKTAYVQQALMKPAQSLVFSNIDDAVDYYDAMRLDIDGNDKKYYIEMDRRGDFVRVLVYDGVACYDTDSIFDDMSEVEFDKWSVNVNDVYEGNKKDSLHGCYNAN